jgi:hypothetical protein
MPSEARHKIVIGATLYVREIARNDVELKGRTFAWLIQDMCNTWIRLNRGKIGLVLLYVIVLGNFLILVSPGFDSPAHFYYDESLLCWSAAAISHMVWGLGVTKGQIAFFTGDWAVYIFPLMGRTDALQVMLDRTRNASGPVFLGRYPPGIGLTLYFFFSVLGLHFWVARLATTIFHVGTLILFTFNLHRRTNKYSLALIGGLLFSTVPTSSYFGRLVDQFIPALFFMTLGATLYSNSFESKTSVRRLAPALVSVCVACFYNWIGFILFAVILLVELVRKDRSPKVILAGVTLMLSMLLVLVVPLAMLGVSLGGYHGTTIVSNLTTMFGIFLHRTFLYTKDDSNVPFTGLQWIASFFRVNVWGFTLLVIPLTLGGLILGVKKATRMPVTYAGRINSILGLVGVLWVLLMAQGVYVHMYYQYFLLPGEVYFASVLLDRVYSLKWRFRWFSIALVIVALLVIYYLSRVTIFSTFF